MAGSRSGNGPGPTEGPLVVGFVGPSNVGKTSLLERLIPALAARGLSVAAVKHSSHGFAADRPGKDSHRLYTAGAAAVALISREQLATFTRRDESVGLNCHRWPRRKAMLALRETIRHKISRRFHLSLQDVIHEIKPILRGWRQYFRVGNSERHSKPLAW